MWSPRATKGGPIMLYILLLIVIISSDCYYFFFWLLLLLLLLLLWCSDLQLSPLNPESRPAPVLDWPPVRYDTRCTQRSVGIETPLHAGSMLHALHRAVTHRRSTLTFPRNVERTPGSSLYFSYCQQIPRQKQNNLNTLSSPCVDPVWFSWNSWRVFSETRLKPDK